MVLPTVLSIHEEEIEAMSQMFIAVSLYQKFMFLYYLCGNFGSNHELLANSVMLHTIMIVRKRSIVPASEVYH